MSERSERNNPVSHSSRSGERLTGAALAELSAGCRDVKEERQ
jgi:hypothetical protein